MQKGTTAALVGENRHGDIAWLANASGAVTDTRIWDPYGQIAGETGATSPLVGFQGDYTDPVSGQVWMGARWYDPHASIFTARDSVFGQLRTPVTLNRYTYGQADPLEFFDPDGRFGWSTITSFASSVWNGFYNAVVRPVIGFSKWAASGVATVARGFGHASRRAYGATVRVATRIASGSLKTLASGVRAVGACFGEKARACATAAVVAASAIACPACTAVGAAVGAGISSFTCERGDTSCIARGAITGAAASGGAFGAAKLGLGLFGTGAAAGLAGEGTNQIFDGELDPARLAFAALAGGVVAKAPGVLSGGARWLAAGVRRVAVGARGVGSSLRDRVGVGARRLVTDEGGWIKIPGRRGPGPAAGWRVGDPIENLTAAGNSPSWSAIRSRYWKNRAASALDGEFTGAQLERMATGRAPLHPTLDVPMELDHIVPRHAGGGHDLGNLRELWPWQHADVDPFRFYNGPRP